MSQSFEVQATPRAEKGSSHSRRMRRQHTVPAIVYGGHAAPEMISVNHLQLLAQLEHEAFYSHILSLNINGKKEQVVLKGLQRHPYKAQIMHADFFRVSATEKLIMKVRVHFVGEEQAPGVLEGGIHSHNMTEIEIKCLPKDLPEFIEVDVSKVGLEESVHLSAVKLSAGVELAYAIEDEEHDHAVFSIHKPRLEAEPEEEAAVEEAEDGASAEESAEETDKAASDEGETA